MSRGAAGSGAPSVEAVAAKLEQAVLSTMDPSVDNATRAQAYQMLEQAKESASMAVPCGFLLSVHTRPSLARHYGLHLLETSIKYHWESMSSQDKAYVKDNTMKLLASGMKSILEEELYIKDKMSRLVVELAKRMWPQLWASMLEELRSLAEIGFVQTQIVIMTFTRMSEDIAVLQTLESPKRRRDLFQALTGNMKELFQWFLTLLEQHYTAFVEARKALPSVEAQTAMKQHAAIVQCVLECVSSFVEWVLVSHVFADSAKLLQSLCFLLEDDHLKHYAATCLLGVMSRKGSSTERLPLLSLFHNDCIGPVFNAARIAVASTSQINIDANYAFLKTLAQVVAQLGLQFCSMYGKEASATKPKNWEQYLFMLSSFGEHPSMSVFCTITTVYRALFRHKLAVSKCITAETVSKWLEQAVQRIFEHGYPSEQGPSSVYSRMDFDDSDEEYSELFVKTRTEIGGCLRCITVHHPLLIWEALETMTTALLDKEPVVPESHKDDPDKSDICRQWEAHVRILEGAMKGVSYDQSDVISPQRGVDMLGKFVQFESSDPGIQSHIFSCISSLFPFIVHRPDVLPTVFNKILKPITSYKGCYEPLTKLSRQRCELRKHSACLINKLGRNYPKIMLPAFDRLLFIVQVLNSCTYPLPRVQRNLLLDSLLYLNNAKNNYIEQATYIGDVLQPIKELFIELKDILNSPLDFMTYIGLDETPTPNPSQEEGTTRYNRCKISSATRILETVLRRSRYPSTTELQESGGFLQVVSSPDPNIGTRTVVRNPCMEHMMPMMHQLFALIRMSNSLWKPECQAALSAGFAKAHRQPTHEIEAIMGLRFKNLNSEPTSQTEDSSDKGPLEHMKCFLMLLHDALCKILYELCNCSDTVQFYSANNITLYILQAPLHDLQYLPDYRLRALVRVFCRFWIQNCPSTAYNSHLLPVVTHLSTFMCQHLEQRWIKVGSVAVTQQDSAEDEEDDDITRQLKLETPECTEILEALLVHLLNRDYIDLLRAVLLKHRINIRSSNATTDSSATDGTDSAMVVADDDTDSAMQNKPNSAPAAAAANDPEISVAGEFLLSRTDTLSPIMATILKSISCPDSTSSHKAGFILSQYIRWIAVQRQQANDGQQMESNGVVAALSSDEYCGILRSLLMGLQRHGQHSDNQQQLLAIVALCYTALRPYCQELAQILCSLPGAKAEDVKNMDRLAAIAPLDSGFKNTKIEKQKKDCLRKILNSTIGISVSESLKQSVQLSVLPPMFSYKRRNPNIAIEDRDDIGLTNLFA